MQEQWRDEREVMNRLADFARILDGRDWGRVAEVFSETVGFDYGDDGEQRGLPALLDQFRRYLDNCGPSQHLIGSIHLEWQDGLPVTRSYVQARHQGAGPRQHLFLDTHGDYIDRWCREGGHWKISHRRAQWSVFRGDSSVLAPASDSVDI